MTVSMGTFAAEPLDVCRIDLKSEKVMCQHWRGGVKQQDRKQRSIKTVDRWVAVPCKQLSHRLPGVSCNKAFGETRLGEPIRE